MVVVCEGYTRDLISRDNFIDIQRVIGRLVDGLPEEGFTPRLVDSYWSKGAAAMVCQDEPTRDWLADKISTMTAWEGSRLKVVSMDALPTFKSGGLVSGPRGGHGAASFAAPQAEPGLDNRNWRVHERKEEAKGVHLVHSIDTSSVAELEGLRWRPFSGVGQAVFSLLGMKPEGRK